MKHSNFLSLIVVVIFIMAPALTKAQPHLNLVLVPENFVSSTYYYEVSGRSTTDLSLKWDFDHSFHAGTPVDTTNERLGRVHVYLSEDSNFSIYSAKMKSQIIAYLDQVYDDVEVGRIGEEYFGVPRQADIITDTVTTGFVYFGNKLNPKEEKMIITGGSIIVTYNRFSKKTALWSTGILIKKENEDHDSLLVLPDPNLRKKN